jgi:hypothetical protein
MQTTNISHDAIESLVKKGAPWTAIFTAILDQYAPESRSRMMLFRQLQHHFHIPIEMLSVIGGWQFWEKGGYDDATLNRMLQGKLTIKEAAR